MTRPKVSIVICTHRRADLLEGAVKSMVEQTARPGSYEVIVVDNDYESNHVVQAVVNKAKHYVSIKYVHEGRIGLSHARNAGFHAAKANYVGYIDDDAKAHADYVKILLEIIGGHAPDICGGPYYPFYLDPKPIWFLDRYETGSLGDTERYLSSREYLNGSNIVFRRDLLEELGGFEPRFGMHGSRLGYGEETMLMIKAWERHQGLRVHYHPALLVYHLVPRSKMSLLFKIRMSYSMGKSQVYFWKSEARHGNVRHEAPKELMRIVFRIGKSIVKTISRDRDRYPYWQNYLYECTARYVSALASQLRLSCDLLGRYGKDRSRCAASVGS